MRFSAVAVSMLISAVCLAEQGRPRAREAGITPGAGTPGALNAITDVSGVRVGQVTLIEGDSVRTGVTAVLPHGGNLFRDKVPGAVFIGNAFGKLAGSTQVQELGTIETPIVLTNTLAVGTAVEAVVRWTLAVDGNTNVRSVNALVGETNDGGLNDIRSLPVTRDHVLRAITSAVEGPVEEGAVGAGTGTIAFGWKGGIGTSSRVVRLGGAEGTAYTVGVLVQSNYGGRLTIDGRQIWRTLTPGRAGGSTDGSCMIVVATDAPLDARDLERLAGSHDVTIGDGALQVLVELERGGQGVELPGEPDDGPLHGGGVSRQAKRDQEARHEDGAAHGAGRREQRSGQLLSGREHRPACDAAQRERQHDR